MKVTDQRQGAFDWFRERPIPSSRFSTAVFLEALGNRHGEFHQEFLPLAIAGSPLADKGCAAEPLRGYSPSREPICIFNDN